MFNGESASCFVIKDAGDDPDVTNGVEVHAEVTQIAFDSAQGTIRGLSGVEAHPNVTITGGTGIGRVTKPGLAVPPGEWAINPVPRRMIEEAVYSVFPAFPLPSSPFSLHVCISIPDGEERAKKTLNARLGIIGGLSILGTTGIVRPVSAKAWTDTIDAALDVARACGCETVVLSTGRSSEMAVQKFLGIQGAGDRGQGTGRNVQGESTPKRLFCPQHPVPCTLPEEACIMMGDHIAHALQACQKRGFKRPIIACQFAKLLKIACGHINTHAAASELDLARLLEWSQKSRLPQSILDIIQNANTAREIAISSSFDHDLLEMLEHHAGLAVRQHAPDLSPHFFLADYNGNGRLVSPRN
jgi:cobalt-precorrin-5B (C1)-methyltransferase